MTWTRYTLSSKSVCWPPPGFPGALDTAQLSNLGLTRVTNAAAPAVGSGKTRLYSIDGLRHQIRRPEARNSAPPFRPFFDYRDLVAASPSTWRPAEPFLRLLNLANSVLRFLPSA